MRTPKLVVTLAAIALTAGISWGGAGTAAAIAPDEALQAPAPLAYSSGTTVFARALEAPPGTLARVSLGQSAAAAAVPGTNLVTQDVLETSVLTADPAGKNAFGRGAGAVASIARQNEQPAQLEPALAEALSPPPSQAGPTGGALPAQLGPLAAAQLLPSTARAATTSVDNLCLAGEDTQLSRGAAQIANAQLLAPAGTPLVRVGAPATAEQPATGAVSSRSETQLVPQGGGRFGLTSVTTQTLAPLTLFGGTPAQLRIAVLEDIQLRSTATGAAGGADVFYGFVDDAGKPVPATTPVLEITGPDGTPRQLTSQQVIGARGIQLSLGIADVFIGAPVHGLDDNPASAPLEAADGTRAAGAADFIRIKLLPGTSEVGSTAPVDGPLAPVLNPALVPVINGLKPVLAGIQSALAGAGLAAADLRYGHLEALAAVPAGGIVCAPPSDLDPLSQARKDASALSVRPGGTFDYVIRFPNVGDEPLTDVRVVDTFSEGLTFEGAVGSVTPPEGPVRPVAAPQQDGNRLTFTIGTVEPRAFVVLTLTFRVPTDAADGTRYRNEAVISATFRGQPIERKVAAEGPSVIDNFSGPCDVSRSKKFASNEQVRTGDLFAYVVNISNTGAERCTDVTVTDDLGPGVELVSCSDDCTVDGRRLTFRLGTLEGGSTTTVSFVVRVTATEGTLPNLALIQTAEGSAARPSTPGPTITRTTVAAPGDPAGCPVTGCPGARTGPPSRQLPRTGGAAGGPVLAALLVAAGLAVRRRLGPAR